MENKTAYITKSETLRFSYNWNNKLTGQYFTTIRLENQRFQKGKTLTVQLQEKNLFEAMIMDTRILRLEDINEWIAGIDTGYSREDTQKIFRKMYPTKDFTTQKLILILLRKIKRTEPK